MSRFQDTQQSEGLFLSSSGNLLLEADINAALCFKVVCTLPDKASSVLSSTRILICVELLQHADISVTKLSVYLTEGGGEYLQDH